MISNPILIGVLRYKSMILSQLTLSTQQFTLRSAYILDAFFVFVVKVHLEIVFALYKEVCQFDHSISGTC